MADPKPFVDIHCHLLPGLDDGASDWDEVLAMARLAAADGTSTVVATPHQLGNFGQNRGGTVRELVRHVQEFLDTRRVPLHVLPGADVRIEPDMIRKIRAGDVMTLADGGRYVLLELPHELYLPLDRLMADLDDAGLVGILSHPERNLGVLRQPQVLEPLIDGGLLLQVTAGSLAGTFGPEIQAFSERLVSQGWVHFVASDAHGSQSRRPLLGHAFDRLVDLVGDQAAEELCCDNPARVAFNRRVEPGPRRWRGVRLGSWFRWRRAG